LHRRCQRAHRFFKRECRIETVSKRYRNDLHPLEVLSRLASRSLRPPKEP
jgi:hypothetical protein